MALQGLASIAWIRGLQLVLVEQGENVLVLEIHVPTGYNLALLLLLTVAIWHEDTRAKTTNSL